MGRMTNTLSTPPLSETAFHQQLAGYRQQIDAIDSRIVELLHQRTEIVGQVGQLKRQAGLKSYIRSGREAAMVRQMYQQFLGSAFHPHAAAMLWRHIIAASIHHEAPQTLAIPANPRTSPLPWAAADYFGHFVPQIQTQTTYQALTLAMRDTATIAILPAENISQWAAELASTAFAELKIFVQFPFIPTAFEAGVIAYGAAQIIPETTGEDISLFWEAGQWQEVEGYHTNLPEQPTSRWLGSYAKPISSAIDSIPYL